VEIKVSNALPTYGPTNQLGNWCFQVEAMNGSADEIRVTSVGFDLGRGKTLVQTQWPFPGSLPCDIRPHDSALTLFEVDDLDTRGTDTYAKIVGFVDMSDGHRFRSRPKQLRSRD
jgi:hypothetical protein